MNLNSFVAGFILLYMLIERTQDEIIIRLPSYVDSKGLERLVDFLKYKEATARSKATQGDIDKLANEVNAPYYAKMKRQAKKR
ncbi:MAG: hypothetical protein ACHQM6_03110 [Candidatus Kapaibacterium sp.]